jgi:hypothetical protein
MKKIDPTFSIIIMSAVILGISDSLSAQPYSRLNSLDGHKAVYFSDGAQSRALATSERIKKVFSFYNDKISIQPEVTVLVLNKADWPGFTTMPVYGMPHYDEKRNLLIIASENNEFWDSFIPDTKKLPQELSKEISSTYVDAKGNLTMVEFFDLLAIHEIGHAYHFQGSLNMQRKWLGEFFCNLMLHTYIAENEPEKLKALTVFPQMVISGGKEGYKFTSLKDIEEKYDEIGQYYPQNYGWFQSRWHSSAAEVYDSGGPSVILKMWQGLKKQDKKLHDNELVTFLAGIDHSLAEVIINWDK